MRKKVIPLFLTGICLVMIFLFSSQSNLQSNEVSGRFSDFIYLMAEKLGCVSAKRSMTQYIQVNYIIRKCAHFTLFFLLGICLSLLFFSTGRFSHEKQITRMVTIAGLFFSCCDEWHQMFVSGRTPSFRDVCIDTAGVFVAALLGNWIFRCVNRNRQV